MEQIKKITNFLKNKNNCIIFIILIIGTLFIIFPDTQKKEEPVQTAEDTSGESRELSEILSKIRGIGKVSVMVTYSRGFEKNLAYEKKSGITDRGDSGYEQNTDEEAIMDGGSPVILSKNYPKVKGVVVIAEGADDPRVKTDILKAVTVAFDIAPHKVCVIAK